MSHRRAIQARKVLFLVLILLLILGGLCYAIFRVVSNDSEETESKKVRLENDEKATIQSVKTSSVLVERVKTVHASTSTLTISRRKRQQRNTVQDVTSTLSTLPQAPQSESSSIINSKNILSVQGSVEQTSSVVEIKNAPSSSPISSEAQGVETTKTIENVLKATTIVRKISPSNSQSSMKENVKRLTSTPSVQYQDRETSSYKQMELTKSMDKITPSKISQIHSTATATTEISSSVTQTEKTPKLNSSVAINIVSLSIFSSISPTRNTPTSSNTSHARYLYTNNISTPLHLNTSLPTELGQTAFISSNVSDTKVASIQTTKTFITPVVSSSVWTPPYYHPWSNWSECSRDCGGGHAHQTRNCSQDGQCDDLGPDVNTTICNLQKCNETTFDVSVNLTDFEWTDDFHNTSSQAYMNLVEQLMIELRALYGPNVSIVIETVSQGSVIVTFTITFHSSNDINNLTYAISQGSIGNLSVSLVKIVNNMVPRKPDVILVQNITTNSTTIHWSSIQSNESNGILLGYKVIVLPGNMNWTLDVKTTTANVVNLSPDTEYKINILGYNVNGDGEVRSTTFRTQELPPHFLPWGDWSNCSRECGGGLTSRNRSCSKEGMCSHLGDYTQTEHCNVEKCNDTSFQVGLNMTNIDWTDDLSNTSSAAYQELLAKLLAELQRLYPNATIELGTITRGSVLFNFKIIFPKKTTTNTDSFTRNLEENGLGNYTTEVKSIEDTNLPRVPPKSIDVSLVTHHSALISWLPISDEDSNGAILGYKIILITGDNKITVFNVTARASDTEFSSVLQMLAQNTTYRFQMYGYNINGDGPKSERIYFTTKVQIPKIVSANITRITTTHALLSWQKIQDNNETYGIIAGYKIIVTRNHQQIIDDEVSSLESEFHLSDLLPNTSYSINVLGHNHYGDGVISELFNFTTRVQIPKVFTGNISDITRTSVVFTWSRIPDSEANYGLISGYKILIIFEDQHTRNMTVSRNESRIELSDLHTGKSYNLTIYGFNDYGEGVVRDVISFQTRDMIPKPNGLAAMNITSATAKLSWKIIPASEETYGSIEGYKIIVSHGSLTNMTVVRDVTSIVLRNMTSNTTYCFHIVAFNTFGDGTQSNTSCFTTLVDGKHDQIGTSIVVLVKSSQTHLSSKAKLQTHEHLMNITAIRSTTTNQHSSSSALVGSTHQKTYVSSNVPSLSPISSFTFTFDEVRSSNTTAAARVFTAPVQPSTTIAEQNIQTSSSAAPSTTKNPTTKSTTKQPTTTETTTKQSTPSPTKQSTPSTTTLTSKSTSPSTKPTTQKDTSDLNSLSTKSEPTPSTSTPAEAVYIVGKIRLTSKTFDADLDDAESESFKALSSKMKTSLENLFRAEGLQFESIEVLGFSKGSVVVDFYVVTLKSMEYKTDNFTAVLVQTALNSSELGGETFEFRPKDFSTVQLKPTIPPTSANEANKGLQKNDDEDDNAMIVAVVICVLLFLGVLLIVLYIGKKKNWFGKRSKRKVLPEDEDDDDDDSYPSPANDTVRLKTARGGRRSYRARINGGHDTTEC